MILLLLLLPFASARIELVDDDAYDHLFVSINPGPTEAETTINHTGTDVKPLTDQEKDTFHVTKENLQKAVKTISHKKPSDVFIDIEFNNWHEVKRDFKLKSISIVNVTTTEAKQSEKVYANNGTKKETIQAHVYQAYISLNSSHHWSGNTKISANVQYELISPAEERHENWYRATVGENELFNGINILSFADIEAKFDLNPGQSAKFIISARAVKTIVKVEYETKLTGDVVVYYPDGRKGKKFWSYDVNELLSALNVSTVAETREFVTITYIKDFLVNVVDVATGEDIPYTDLVTPGY